VIIQEREIKKIAYSDLNARQKETFNFQKLSAVLADYGFATIQLNDDWQGADFIAQHIDGDLFLKVQLKGRLTFAKKYKGKNLFVAFHYQDSWYLYDHDELLTVFLENTNIGNTDSWIHSGAYSFNVLSKKQIGQLERFRI
jgi:hypothetical protein